jgi:hypothetical protein
MPAVFVVDAVPTAAAALPVNSVLSGNTSGTISIPDVTPALLVIAAELKVLNQNIYQYFQFEATSLAKDVPYSPAAMAVVQARALDQMMQDLSSLVGKGTEQAGATTSIQSGLASMTVAINQLVANVQLIGSAQIDKAEFDKAATNAALKRNNLPEVTVPEANVGATIEKASKKAVTMSTAVEATGAVNTAIGKATSFISTQMDNYIVAPSTAFLSNQFNSLKTALGFEAEDTTKKVNATTKATTNKTALPA